MFGKLILTVGAVLCGAGGAVFFVGAAFHQDVEGDPDRFKSVTEFIEWKQSKQYWSALARRALPFYALGVAMAGAGAALIYWAQFANA